MPRDCLLSEKLASLGIMGDQLRVSLKSLDTIVLCGPGALVLEYLALAVFFFIVSMPW